MGSILSVLTSPIVSFFSAIKRRMLRAKNRAIANYVAKQVQTLLVKGDLELTQVEIRGNTYPVYKHAPATLNAWFEAGKQAHGDKEFLVYVGKPGDVAQRLTYNAFFDLCDRVRTHLVQDLGVKRGDRVAILMANIPEFCVLTVAAIQAGAIACPLNAFWEGKELEFGMLDSGSTVLVADEKRLMRLVPDQRLEKLIKNGVKVVVIKPTSSELSKHVANYETLVAPLKGGKPSPIAMDLDPEADAVLVYTSGTSSGRAKGVVLTHRSFTQTLMCYQLFSRLLKQLRGQPKHHRTDLVTSPMFHTAGLTPTFLLAFGDGHKLVLIPRWNTEEALQVCLAEGVTMFGAMPTMLSDILNSETFKKNLDKFKFTNIGTGGASTPSDLIHRCHAALPQVSQGSGWGMTETNSIGTVIGAFEYLEFPNSCGKPHAIVSVKLIDPETGQDTKSDIGELCIKTPTAMRCYWNMPEETAKTFLPGGWVRTGDLGRIDPVDGFVFIVDRVKEVVIRAGENISCNEVEDCIYSFPGECIYEAACFGLPDARLGEVLAAAVVLKEHGKQVNEQDIIKHCSDNLAKFKVPIRVFVRPYSSPLPRGGTGKILKRVLKHEYAGGNPSNNSNNAGGVQLV